MEVGKDFDLTLTERKRGWSGVAHKIVRRTIPKTSRTIGFKRRQIQVFRNFKEFVALLSKPEKRRGLIQPPSLF